MFDVEKAVGNNLLVDGSTFSDILDRKEPDMVISSKIGIVSKSFVYMVVWGNFNVLVISKLEISLPEKHKSIYAKKIVNPVLIG